MNVSDYWGSEVQLVCLLLERSMVQLSAMCSFRVILGALNLSKKKPHLMVKGLQFSVRYHPQFFQDSLQTASKRVPTKNVP